jgi:hypothetical protein
LEEGAMAPIDRLQAAREALVRIVKTREDGRRYVPIVLRIEQEIAAGKELADDYLRIISEAA